MRGSGEERRGAGSYLRRHLSRHHAVVSPVAAAAGRQARLCAGREDRRKRPQPKRQNQESAKRTPHRTPTLCEKKSVRGSRQCCTGRRRRSIAQFYHPTMPRNFVQDQAAKPEVARNWAGLAYSTQSGFNPPSDARTVPFAPAGVRHAGSSSPFSSLPWLPWCN
jgi:hypothetical protein